MIELSVKPSTYGKYILSSQVKTVKFYAAKAADPKSFMGVMYNM